MTAAREVYARLVVAHLEVEQVVRQDLDVPRSQGLETSMHSQSKGGFR